jgi:hypothetical protein
MVLNFSGRHGRGGGRRRGGGPAEIRYMTGRAVTDAGPTGAGLLAAPLATPAMLAPQAPGLREATYDAQRNRHDYQHQEEGNHLPGGAPARPSGP